MRFLEKEIQPGEPVYYCGSEYTGNTNSESTYRVGQKETTPQQQKMTFGKQKKVPLKITKEQKKQNQNSKLLDSQQ